MRASRHAPLPHPARTHRRQRRRPHPGQSESRLAAIGERQAAVTGTYLRTQSITALFSSPLERARRTAEIIGAELGITPQFVDGLKELHTGCFTGRLRTQCRELFPDDFAAWQSDDPDFSIPGGESRRMLMARARAALEHVRAAAAAAAAAAPPPLADGLPPGISIPRSCLRVAVVAHGGLLAAALKSLLGIPAEQNPFSLLNCSITEIEWGSPVALIRFNDVSHLAELSAASSPGDL